MDAPYFVDIEVPETVLLAPEPGAAPMLHPNESGAVWYKADPASLEFAGSGAVQKWSPQEGLGEPATPAKPNEGNLTLSSSGGLAFERGVNAGLVIGDALIDPIKFSCAIRYSSDLGDARTLLTVNSHEQDTYLFLSEKDGHISWEDQKNQSSTSQPAPKGGGWIVAGFDQGVLSLAVAAFGSDLLKPISSETSKAEIALDFGGVSDVFIGCRSHRKGILKTLGTSRVHEVLIWIDQDVCRVNEIDINAVLRHCEHKDTMS